MKVTLRLNNFSPNKEIFFIAKSAARAPLAISGTPYRIKLMCQSSTDKVEKLKLAMGTAFTLSSLAKTTQMLDHSFSDEAKYILSNIVQSSSIFINVSFICMMSTGIKSKCSYIFADNKSNINQNQGFGG